MPGIQGPKDIPFKAIFVCVIFLVGVGFLSSVVYNPELTPDQRVWALVIGLAIFALLLGGSVKLDDIF